LKYGLRRKQRNQLFVRRGYDWRLKKKPQHINVIALITRNKIYNVCGNKWTRVTYWFWGPLLDTNLTLFVSLFIILCICSCEMSCWLYTYRAITSTTRCTLKSWWCWAIQSKFSIVQNNTIRNTKGHKQIIYFNKNNLF
jgi:hypothetical protein